MERTPPQIAYSWETSIRVKAAEAKTKYLSGLAITLVCFFLSTLTHNLMPDAMWFTVMLKDIYLGGFFLGLVYFFEYRSRREELKKAVAFTREVESEWSLKVEEDGVDDIDAFDLKLKEALQECQITE